MKIVSRKYRQHFPEILSTAHEHLELVFGLEMKEIDRSRNIYTLISKLNLGGNDCLSGEGELPKSGLLMVLFRVIFMNGNCATEEEIWEFLSMLGIYAGRRHWIFGEPRRLITKDLVQKEYLNYRQVPNSDPSRCEFLWGLRACAETSKMKVLEVLAKFQGKTLNFERLARVLPELPCTGDHQELQGAMAPSSPDAGHSCTGSDEGAQGPEEESAVASKAAPSTQSPLIDPLTRKASMLVELLLEKDTKKEPILQHTLLKVIGRKYTQHFPENLRRASKHMELVFGLELMEVYRSRIIYALMYKLNLSGGGLYQGSLGSLRSPEGSSPKIWYRRST
ncbi:hypothetical protein MG293_005864 [Ovis ammon polii]|uniref:MAGE domain-containing protein n=1 Tax=Ovis ammon polii TaxID=230172 RepID=A0AAD4UE83_OVIAM|nr:hypothetical protein MG293_005864 [Ovis ammon polii]